MGILTGYSEPHEIADAYYARLDEERERLLMSVNCGDCVKFREVPRKWVTEWCGYCEDCGEFVLYDDIPSELGCDAFE